MLLRIVLVVTVFFGPRVRVACYTPCNASAAEGLLARLRPDAPPPAPLTVLLGLAVHLATVQERDATLKVLADFTMSWKDSRLPWNETEWGCDSATVSAERLWVPDVGPLGAEVGGAAPLSALLASDGGVLYTARLQLAVPLELDLTHWPHDLQTARLRFASRAYTVDQIDLSIKPDEERLVLLGSGGWRVESVRGEIETVGEAEGGGARRAAVWAVAARRRAEAHAAATAAVLAALALLQLAAALLPPAQRAPLAATAALIACFWLITWVGRLGGSVSVPRRVRAMCWLCALSGSAAVCAAAVCRLARRAKPPPPALRAALSKLAPYCALVPLQVDTTENSGMSAMQSSGGAGAGGAAWAAAALLADRALRAALLVALLAVLCTAA